jgi:heptosyltransferase III
MAGLADRTIPFDSPALTGLFMVNGPGQASELGPLHAAIAWCADPDGILETNLHRLRAQQVVVAPSRPAETTPLHVADHLLATLRPLGIGTHHATTAFRFDWPEEVSRMAADHLDTLGLADRHFVAVHPGSGSLAKNWPAEHAAAVIRGISAMPERSCLVVAGPADGAMLDRLVPPLDPPTPIARDLPLAVLGALLERADAYLGNDSGPTHLAAMLGVPTLALFGPTDPARWAPRGRRVRVLRHEPLGDLTPTVVLTALRQMARPSDPRA